MKLKRELMITETSEKDMKSGTKRQEKMIHM